ncbi:hypothetical protein SNOG_01435 [Parastagonospora nodorum SN15]|uniref:Uncharacterized protein n=1 Tax=Phaeosphaeria nodorum (strain SN15 / ATCC MYA-4574 / FGSC 10173) TaxID=321614 RepID=Q0V3H9_PHANO|nr:hypothetical protein SNOG_01435 [Parastagonospora nodorum SN15]EAT91084.1 hypothetical protein SNOG_01435 [Parastagonospora nodorum SN15]
MCDCVPIPICFQCGTYEDLTITSRLLLTQYRNQNPCHCKIIGPTIGSSAGQLRSYAAAARQMLGRGNAISNAIPI